MQTDIPNPLFNYALKINTFYFFPPLFQFTQSPVEPFSPLAPIVACDDNAGPGRNQDSIP
jgi:hypothetical protein